MSNLQIVRPTESTALPLAVLQMRKLGAGSSSKLPAPSPGQPCLARTEWLSHRASNGENLWR